MVNSLDINYTLSGDELLISENIYLSITPATYVGAGLYEMDNIANHLLQVTDEEQESR